MTKRELRQYFDYHPDGGFIVKKQSSRRLVGSIIFGSLHHMGYRNFRFKNRTETFHRAVWIWHYGRLGKFVDHIDGNRTNNRIENLREVTQSQNGWNSKTPASNTHGVKGLYWDKRDSLWYCAVKANGVRKKIYSKHKHIVLEKLKNLRKEMHGVYGRP